MVYLEITLNVVEKDRPAAAAIYNKYKAPFLSQAKGALSKQLLIRDDDVQVLHGFASMEDAKSYLDGKLFADDVVGALKPLLASSPDVRLYEAI